MSMRAVPLAGAFALLAAVGALSAEVVGFNGDSTFHPPTPVPAPSPAATPYKFDYMAQKNEIVARQRATQEAIKSRAEGAPDPGLPAPATVTANAEIVSQASRVTPVRRHGRRYKKVGITQDSKLSATPGAK